MMPEEFCGRRDTQKKRLVKTEGRVVMVLVTCVHRKKYTKHLTKKAPEDIALDSLFVI